MPDPPLPQPSPQQLLPKFYRWSDAISPLVLLRCIQPAFSLTILLLACAAYWGTFAVHDLLDHYLAASQAAAPLEGPSSWLSLDPPPQNSPAVNLQWLNSQAFGRAVRYSLSPAATLAWSVDNPQVWNALLKQLIIYLLWLVPIGLVLRASITSCAERRDTSLKACLRLLRSRAVAMVSVLLIPLLAVLFAAAAYWLIGFLARLAPVIADVLMLVCVPFLIAAGVLAVGSLFAVPLAWASLLTETDCDPFDALSRGYEYTLRRLIPLAIYVLAAWGIHWVAFRLVEAICIGGWNIAERLVRMSADGQELPGISEAFVLHLPDVFSVVLFWSLVGGIYLLLRRDANDQEIEDIQENLLPSSR
ncbi:hypothetical protein [Roseimaritima ulvae]|uniref:Uncharacterized protein n=1 Tax=Roseimaritima ulvae TaxID=980254 RepID=A0A5B9QTP7_9BACT|nr:hypothetical protein [Roseimaritima ulvae]QEG41120.1 hypothetical protein UC8_31390 [Roseimaritima ulvae]